MQAPLEEPASSVKTPNPSKAPWYFLGLQEMLVYYDPWMAGVVLPSLIIVGLMAIPYIDFNKKGNGYYTFDQRKFSYLIVPVRLPGLWVTLIVLGTFLRGPNWNFFGPFEYLGSAQSAGAEQRRPVGILLGAGAWTADCPRRPSGSGMGIEIAARSPVRELPGHRCWCWSTSSRCRR